MVHNKQEESALLCVTVVVGVYDIFPLLPIQDEAIFIYTATPIHIISTKRSRTCIQTVQQLYMYMYMHAHVHACSYTQPNLSPRL